MRGLVFLVFSFFILSSSYSQQYHPVKKDGKWGLIDTNGNVFVEPEYDAVGMFKDNYALVQKGDKVGLISRQGVEVVSPAYDEIAVLDSALFSVFEDDRWKMIDDEGRVLLDVDPDQLESREGGFVGVLMNGLWGAALYDGSLILDAEFDDIEKFEKNYFLIYKNGKKGLADKDGQIILEPECLEIDIHLDKMFFFKADRLWSAVDTGGQQVLDARWKSFGIFNHNFVRLTDTANTAALYSLALPGVIGFGQYDGFLPFSNTFSLTRKGYKVGLIDSLGISVLSPVYDEIQAYGDGLFRVQSDGQWGVVRQNDDIVIPLEFDYVGPLRNDVAVVKKGGDFGIVSASGETVAPIKYKEIRLEENVAHAYIGEKFELLVFDDNGRLTDEDHYNNFGRIRIGFRSERGRPRLTGNGRSNDYILENFEWFFHGRSGKWGLRDLNSGAVVMPPTYQHIEVKKDLGFTVVALESKNKQSFDRTIFDFWFVYGIIDNTRGLPITQVNMLDIRFEDIEVKNLPVARVVFAGGRHGLINRKGAVVAENYTFIGEFESGLARMSTKGKLGVKKYDGELHLGLLDVYLSNLRTLHSRESMTKYDIELERRGKLICDGCEWGFIDTTTRIVIQPSYEFAKSFVNNVAIVKQGAKWGTIGPEGEILLDCEFSRIHFIENSGNRMLRIYINKEQYGIIDSTGKVIVEVDYDKVEPFSEGMAAVRKGYRWGFVNEDGIEVVPCKYEKVRPYSEGLAAVRFKRKWGYIDKSGNLVIDHGFRRAGDFHEGLAWTTVSSKSGYIDKTGKIAIEAVYTQCFDFNEGVARIRVSGDFGLIDRTGGYILKPKMDKINPFNLFGVAVYQDAGGYGVINRRGEKLTKMKFQDIDPFSEGYAKVRFKGKYGFINTLGDLVVPAIYTRLEPFREGRARFADKGKWGFIDKEGKIMVEPEFSKCLDYNGGVAVVYKGYRRSGLVDYEGNFLINPKIDRLLGFSEGKGLVRDKNYRHYYITTANRFYVGFYQDAKLFSHGVAAVRVGGKWGIINQKGIEMIPPKYEKVFDFQNGYAMVRIKQFSGIANLDGEVIVEPEYEYITYTGDGLIRVEKGNRLGYLTLNGQWIWNIEP